MSGPVRLKIVRGIGFHQTIRVYKLERSGGRGPAGGDGPAGATGDTGPAGPQGDPGEGVATGGTIGQVLKKQSAADFDTDWEEEAGGNEGSWRTIESRPMTGLLVELFDVGADDNIRLVFDGLGLSTPVNNFFVALSIDNGVTYPSTHDTEMIWMLQPGSSVGGFNSFLATAFRLVAGWPITDLINGFIEFNQVSQALLETTFDSKFRSGKTGQISRTDTSGLFQTVGIVNKVKVEGGAPLDQGTIHLQKRTF